MSNRMTVKDVAADVAELKALILQIAGQPAAPAAPAAPVAKPVAKPRKAKAPADPDKARVSGLFKAGPDARKAFRKELCSQLGIECGPTYTVKVLIGAANDAGCDWRPIADQLITS